MKGCKVKIRVGRPLHFGPKDSERLYDFVCL